MLPKSNTPATGAMVHQLLIKPIFDALEPHEKLYAHHMARAAWHGSRIIMRQVSSESPGIFDFIMDLYRASGGKWNSLVAECEITAQELQSFLEYAGTFLCNMGNYYGEGDQKFVPDLTPDVLRKIASISPKASDDLEKIMEPLMTVPPFSLGYPGSNAASAYYPTTEPISEPEIAKVSKIMEKHAIGPENTRLQKILQDGNPVYNILQSSVDIDETPRQLADDVFLVRGDHAEELGKVIRALSDASKHVANSKQSLFLKHYIDTFRTSDLNAFQESQKAWVTDAAARVENLIGFIEPYRDPAGIRSEWEAMVGIADADEASRLQRLVDSSSVFIRQLPWAVEGVNDGKGPFEKSLFEAPDFTSVHGKCSSLYFDKC